MTAVIKWFWLKDPSSGLFRLSPRIVIGLAGRRSYSKYLIVCWRKKKRQKKKKEKKDEKKMYMPKSRGCFLAKFYRHFRSVTRKGR